MKQSESGKGRGLCKDCGVQPKLAYDNSRCGRCKAAYMRDWRANQPGRAFPVDRGKLIAAIRQTGSVDKALKQLTGSARKIKLGTWTKYDPGLDIEIKRALADHLTAAADRIAETMDGIPERLPCSRCGASAGALTFCQLPAARQCGVRCGGCGDESAVVRAENPMTAEDKKRAAVAWNLRQQAATTGTMETTV